MQSTLTAPTLVPLSDAAKLFPSRNGKHPHILTLRRRILHGTNGVKLKAVRSGRDWFTCREWIEEFTDACTRKALPESKADVRAMDWHNEQSKRRLKEEHGIHVDENAAAIRAEIEAEIAAEEMPDVSIGCSAAPTRPLRGVLPSGVSSRQGRQVHVGSTPGRRPH